MSREDRMAEKQQQSCAVEASGVEGELISEIEELVSQFDPSGPNFEWKKKKACGIQEMIFELREQIRNRNQHIQQLELALQEILEKYRQQIEAQDPTAIPVTSPVLGQRSEVKERIRYLNSLCSKSDVPLPRKPEVRHGSHCRLYGCPSLPNSNAAAVIAEESDSSESSYSLNDFK